MTVPICVLIVDDDADLADLTATFVERADEAMRTVVETDPRSALDTLAEDATIDCVVSDYDMPDMDGLTFFDAVRDVRPNLPFVLFTGKGSEEIASDAISAGVTDYLQKETGTDQYTVLANRVGNAVEHARAQRRLAERERRHRALVEGSTDIITVFNADSTIRYQSPSVDRHTGYDWEETLGTSGLEYVHPDDADDVRAAFAQAVADPDTTPTVEYRFRERDGSWCAMESRLCNRLDDPAVEGIVAYTRNVAERAERERELRENEQKYATLVEEANEGVVIVQDGAFVFANRQATDLLDTTRDALYGTPLAEAVAPEDRDLARDRYERRLAGEEIPARYELTALSASGERVPVALTSSIITYDGDPAVMAVCRDISEQREQEAALRQYETIVETAPDGVFIVDDEARFVGVNDGGAALTGRSRERLLGTPVPELVADGTFGEEVIPGYLDVVRDLLSSGNDRERGKFEFDVTPTEGSRRTVECHVALRPGDGEFRGSIGIMRDVTERKRREQELERQNDRLEEFAGVVSHDLRNPLNVAQGRLGLYRETGDGDHLDAVARSHSRLEQLLEDLLELARVGGVETERVALDAVAAAAWQTVETPGGDLTVRDACEVEADASGLQRLFENLFRNSVEHGTDDATEQTPEGPAVRVEVGLLDDEAGFYVEDDGPGIPDGEREQVFESGYSLSGDGTGFGLAIVRRVAADHGWTVAAVPGDGGARFEIAFDGGT